MAVGTTAWIGTPLARNATRVMMLGSGELGKEVVIELQRFGVEVIAVDRYANAPAMQVAHRSHVVNMLDPEALAAVIEAESPDLVVPEIEAIIGKAIGWSNSSRSGSLPRSSASGRLRNASRGRGRSSTPPLRKSGCRAWSNLS